MPQELRQAAQGNVLPVVVVTNSDGSKPITGFTASGNTAKSVKQIARDLKKKIRETPEIIAAGPATETKEEVAAAPESKEDADASTAYNVLVESRKWTNTSGKTITAAVLSVDVSDVTFLMSGDKQVKYPLANLSAGSRAALAELTR
jgi:hypothetical protein